MQASRAAAGAPREIASAGRSVHPRDHGCLVARCPLPAANGLAITHDDDRAAIWIVWSHSSSYRSIIRSMPEKTPSICCRGPPHRPRMLGDGFETAPYRGQPACGAQSSPSHRTRSCTKLVPCCTAKSRSSWKISVSKTAWFLPPKKKAAPALSCTMQSR